MAVTGHRKKNGGAQKRPLVEVDDIVSAFASEFGFTVTKNQKDWPERSVTWGSAVHRLIQLYLANEESLTFNLWLCAHQDRGGKRYWKQENLVTAKPISEFRDALPSLLRNGKAILEGWGEDQLQFATNLERL
jgi:hypothetical protein